MWQGNRGEPATANPKTTSMHRNTTRTVRRTHASLLAGAGRCWLAGVCGVPEPAFSPATRGSRASEEGDLSPLRRSMAEDAALEENKRVGTLPVG